MTDDAALDSARPEPAAECLLPDGRGGVVHGLWTGPQDPEWTLVYAPGAGADLRDGFGRWAARSLASVDIACLRFQFPYSEAGRRVPDRPSVLEATWNAAITVARERGGKLVVSGRSMGGRIASHVVASGAAVDALVLFAYPLHPPGRPDQLRDAHLPHITVPTLFISGTNDVFGTPDELRTAAASVPGATLHFIEGADHSYRAPKRIGRTQESLWREAIETTIAWLRAGDRTAQRP